MTIVITTPKGRYKLSSISLSFITFLFICMIALALAALLVGFFSQLLVLLSPFLIHAGMDTLQFSVVTFLSYRISLWLWRLGLRRAWNGSYAYRRELEINARRHWNVLVKLLTILLFR